MAAFLIGTLVVVAVVFVVGLIYLAILADGMSR